VVKTIQLRVTSAHIAKGKPNRGNLCPIALALKARGFLCVAVGRAFFEVDEFECNPMPKAMQQFVWNFDHKRTRASAKPARFRVQLRRSES
jgi:hypothetical protein